jgi:hypothetical protein
LTRLGRQVASVVVEARVVAARLLPPVLVALSLRQLRSLMLRWPITGREVLTARTMLWRMAVLFSLLLTVTLAWKRTWLLERSGTEEQPLLIWEGHG